MDAQMLKYEMLILKFFNYFTIYKVNENILKYNKISFVFTNWNKFYLTNLDPDYHISPILCKSEPKSE